MEATMTIWKLRAGRGLAAVVAMVGLSVMVPVGAAQAGTSCSYLTGCSRVGNNSWLRATARHNWTCGWGTTGSSSTGCVGGDSMNLYHWEATPDGQDWDVVQVDAGWCYRIHFVNGWGKVWDVRYDRRGQSNLYVKVENGAWGTVEDQSSSGCP